MSIPDCRSPVNRFAPVSCAVCGRRVERRMRGQLYCSPRCRDRGRNRCRKKFVSAATGAPATPHKSANKNNGLQPSKSASSLFGNAPLNLLGGGPWRWPDAVYPDSKTVANIIHREVGGRRIEAQLGRLDGGATSAT